MSTNSRHPLAAHDHFDLRAPAFPASDFSLTTLNDTVLLMIFHTSLFERNGTIFAMDWKTGEMILVRC